MIFIKPILSILVAFPLNYVQGLTPDGANVCLVTEAYNQTVTQREWRKVSKHTQTWCWDVSKGFKCSKRIIDLQSVDVPRTVIRTKIVPKCCKGYKEDFYLDKCYPLCHYGCVKGNCTAPETCSCDPGFQGFKCDIPCEPGSWGGNCLEKCNCPNDGNCNKVTGKCFTLTTTTEKNIFTSNSDLVNEKETDFSETILFTTTKTMRNTITTQSKFEEFQTEATDQNTPEENLTTEESVTTILENKVIKTTTDKVDEITTSTEKEEINTTTQEIQEINTTTQKIEETSTTTEEKEEMTTQQKTEKSETYFHTSTEPIQTTTLIFTTPKFTITMEETTEFTVTKENLSIKEAEKNEITTEDSVYTTEISNTIETDFYWKENEFIKNREIEDLTNNDTILNKQNKHVKIVHFVPSLTVLTGVCILLFIIVTRYLIVRSRRRKQKLILENQQKFFHSQRNQNTDSVFTISNFSENPVYLSEEELNNKTPVLQTFKPLNVESKSQKTNETTFR